MLLRLTIGLLVLAGLMGVALPVRSPAAAQALTPTLDILPTPPPYQSTTATAHPPATATITASPTPTLPSGERADTCEPNDEVSQPCQLPTETLVQDLTFIDDQIDVYSFLLKASRTYTITVTAGDGIDPFVRLYRAETLDTPIVTRDDDAPGQPGATISTTTGDADAWYVLIVENRGPAGRAGAYTVQAISRAAASLPARSVSDTQGDADPLENNYDPLHAAQLAWGVPYDLSLRCPERRPDACPAGDHDFLLIPVKAGVPIVIVTYDLGQGTDTLLTAYAPDAAQSLADAGQLVGWRAIVSNDDFVAGWTLRSQLLIRPNWNGWLLLIVAPSSRTDPPTIPHQQGPTGRYRLIIGPPTLASVRQVLEAQQDLPPTPTRVPTREGGSGGNGGGSGTTPRPEPTAGATPMGDATPAPDSRGNRDPEIIINEKCSTGRAVVRAEMDAPFWAAAAPKDHRAPITTYPPGTEVQLLGKCYIGWVKVQPLDAVTPGWMEARYLVPLDVDASPLDDGTPAVEAPELTPPPTPADSDAIGEGQRPDSPAPLPTAATGQIRPLTVVPLGPAPTPTIPVAVPEARTVVVEVCVLATEGGQRCVQPLVDVPIMLSHAATHETLHSGRTQSDGQVRLSASVPAGTGLLIVLPSLGIEQAVPATNTTVAIRVPRQGGAP